MATNKITCREKFRRSATAARGQRPLLTTGLCSLCHMHDCSVQPSGLPSRYCRNYLRRFGVDRIKIAREFIADLGTCSDAAAIVKCIFTLARDLGNEVIAEGVETPEQLKLLQGWDCPDIQGFYFAAPMPAETVSPLLSAGAIVRPN